MTHITDFLTYNLETYLLLARVKSIYYILATFQYSRSFLRTIEPLTKKMYVDDILARSWLV